jgi:membrane glycosyltransferase
MGNLQHFWFLFAPGIDFANRFHIWTGIMAYISSPLWLLFLITGAADLAIKHRFSLLSSLPNTDLAFSVGAVHLLLLATLGLLFIPKILAVIMTLPRAKKYGGAFKLSLSAFLETILWTLLAPALMLYYTQFVVMNLLGLQVQWSGQNRSDDKGLSLIESFRIFWLPPVVGLFALAALLTWTPTEMLLISPILAGWFLAPVLACMTSKRSLGERAREKNLFIIPEEIPSLCPQELKDVENIPDATPLFSAISFGGLARAVVDPLTHSLHVALLRDRRRGSALTDDHLSRLRIRLLEEGPSALQPSQQYALMWHAESLRWLHHEFWSRPASRLHPWWNERFAEITRKTRIL